MENEVVVNSRVKNKVQSNALNSLNYYGDIMEGECLLNEQDSATSLDDPRRPSPSCWRVEPPTTKDFVIDELYATMQLPVPARPARAQVDKTTRSAMVQDSGATLFFNQTLLLLSQLHLWIGYALGVVLPVTRSYATQLAPEAIVSNLDLVVSYFVQLICYLYIQLKLLIQEELTRWTSLFLYAVWESLMRLSVYR